MNIQHHSDYQRWLKELNFYEDLLIVFQKELNMVIEKHADLFSIVEHVEEYKNIFAKKKKRLRELQHQLMGKERVLIANERTASTSWNYDEIEKGVRHFIAEMEALKKNLRRFVAKNKN